MVICNSLVSVRATQIVCGPMVTFTAGGRPLPSIQRVASSSMLCASSKKEKQARRTQKKEVGRREEREEEEEGKGRKEDSEGFVVHVMADLPSKERVAAVGGYPSIGHVLLHDNNSGTTLFPQVELLFEDDEIPSYIDQAVRVELDKDGRIAAIRSSQPGIKISNFRVSQESDGSDTLHVEGFFPTQ